MEQVMEKLALQPTQWASIPEIDAVPKLSDQDFAVFNELRDVLKRHAMLDRFGVMLLHRHFDIAEHEMMMETIDTVNRTLTVRPVEATTMPSHIQTSWRFFAQEGAAGIQGCVGCVTVCPWVGDQHTIAHTHGET